MQGVRINLLCCRLSLGCSIFFGLLEQLRHRQLNACCEIKQVVAQYVSSRICPLIVIVLEQFLSSSLFKGPLLNLLFYALEYRLTSVDIWLWPKIILIGQEFVRYSDGWEPPVHVRDLCVQQGISLQLIWSLFVPFLNFPNSGQRFAESSSLNFCMI